jgi:DNA repair protein RadC
MKKAKDNQAHYEGHRERLRKRFLESGINGFHDYELLEFLLTYSISRKDTKTLGKALIKRFRDIPGVLDADIEELLEVNGIGERSAVLVKFTASLLEFYIRAKTISGKKLNSPEAVINYCRVSMGWLRDEQFRALYLNSQNELLAEELLQKGTVDQAIVFPRKVLELALKHKASGVLLIHNHPGGLLKPSKSDLAMTERLKSAASEMGIRINDHLIITKGGYYSFHEKGLL